MIAFYLRLSMADGDLGNDDKDESNSIEHQRAILMDYINRREDLQGDILEYVDDGYSGTNFNRPAFGSLLDDMKSGKIDVLLTKDLSRLGRNYIEVGDYMEQVFPLLGVRYIAVNSNYDSNNYIGSTSGIEMSFMNLVNSLYSKDLSKKYRSAVETRWKNGKSTSGRMPLGYVRHPEERGEWVIEPIGRDIVRKIYGMVNEGLDMGEIVDRLNDDNVMTPGKYREAVGHVKTTPRKVAEHEYLWNKTMLRRVLQTYEYTGAMIQSKMKTIIVGSGRRRTVPESERFVTEGHHEPIISMEEYERGQALFRKIKKGAPANSGTYPLRDKIYCGNCRLSMRCYEKAGGNYVRCVHKQLVGAASGCHDDCYSTEIIDSAVKKALRLQFMELQKLNLAFTEVLSDTRQRDAVKSFEKEIHTLQMSKTQAYEDYVRGWVSKQEYIAERDAIKRRIEVLESMKEEAARPVTMKADLHEEAEHFIDLLKESPVKAELSQELADALIEKVYIYDAQHIEVVFKFSDLLGRMLKEGRRERIA